MSEEFVKEFKAIRIKLNNGEEFVESYREQMHIHESLILKEHTIGSSTIEEMSFEFYNQRRGLGLIDIDLENPQDLKVVRIKGIHKNVGDLNLSKVPNLEHIVLDDVNNVSRLYVSAKFYYCYYNNIWLLNGSGTAHNRSLIIEH